MTRNCNHFFYANVCHICKKFGNGISLKKCGNCTMISYCSKEHQKEHWPQHKYLCNAICNVLKDKKLSKFLNDRENHNIENWAQMKMNFMLLVTLAIGRKLEHYEEEMFKFLRSCVVCHELNVKTLENCPNCPNASFCKKHKNDTMHKHICHLMKLCFKLDVFSLMHKHNIPEIILPYHTDHVNLPENMKHFIDHYTKLQKNVQISMDEEAIINSEYLTRPLTFLYAIQKLEYILKDDSIIVHIVAANMIDIDGIELWEILLHWIPSVITVKMILIGPELSSGSLTMNLCKHCQSNNKKFSIQTYNMLYEDYSREISYVKPNFIIGYNAGIHECEDIESNNDTWRQSLRTVAEQNCPFVLTSYTLAEAEKEQIRLNEILGNRVKCAYFEWNPYSSLRPYRDFETEGVYYQNQYIIIYKNLQTL
ncbi:hypothetical protein ANTQUA_LOCUS7775 [Anthophora quadrimaculata]